MILSNSTASQGLARTADHTQAYKIALWNVAKHSYDMCIDPTTVDRMHASILPHACQDGSYLCAAHAMLYTVAPRYISTCAETTTTITLAYQ